MITPPAIGGTEEEVAKGVSWALSVLGPVINGTAVGCPNNIISPNLMYLQSEKPEGPNNPPPVKDDGNTDDNVYNKVYFGGETSPTNPICKT